MYVCMGMGMIHEDYDSFCWRVVDRYSLIGGGHWLQRKGEGNMEVKGMGTGGKSRSYSFR